MPRPLGRPPKHLVEQLGDTREALLEAAAEVFATAGFEGASLHSIAARVGLTTGAIYNHFDNKADLMIEVVKVELGTVAKSGEQFEGASPAELFALTARHFLDPRNARTRLIVAELHVASRRHPELAALLDAFHLSELEALTRLIGSSRADVLHRVKLLELVLLGLTHVEDLDPALPHDKAFVAMAAELAASLAPQPARQKTRPKRRGGLRTAG